MDRLSIMFLLVTKVSDLSVECISTDSFTKYCCVCVRVRASNVCSLEIPAAHAGPILQTWPPVASIC